MRLLGCHIVGFGSFANYDLWFETGLNVVFQPNGWGKTTISAFIEAMLYGFARKRVHNVQENKRLRYAPWSGGRYGGSLDLECGGRRYRITRTFGKSAAGDRMGVMDIDTGRRVSVKAPSIGEWLLGLDSSAFQRSVFIGSNGIEFDGPVTGLRNRLNALVGEAEDAPSFDQAISVLDDRRRYYKKTGNRGRIAEVDSDLDKLLKRRGELEELVRQSGDLQAEQDIIQKQLKTLDEQLASMQKSLDEARGKDKELTALMEVRKNLVSNKEKSESALESFRGNMPPDFDESSVKHLEDEVSRIEHLAADMAEIDAQLEGLDQQTAQVKAHYGNSTLTREDLESWIKQIATLQQVRSVLDSLLAEVATQPGFTLMASMPASMNDARSLVESWPVMEDMLRETTHLESEANAAEMAWTLARQRVLEAAAKLDATRANVPDDVDETMRQLNDALKELRDCLRKKEQLDTEMSVLKAKIEASDERFRGVEVTDEDLAHIDQLTNAARGASKEVVPLREKADALAEQAQECKRQYESAQSDLASARSNVTNAELQRATAIREEADAKAANDASGRAGNGTPVVGIACIVLGFVLAVAGVLVFLPLLAAALALVAFGVYRVRSQQSALSAVADDGADVQRASSRLEECERVWTEAQDELQSSKNRFKAADEELKRAEEASALASDALAQSLASERESQEVLAREVNSLLPGEDLKVEVVVAQIDSLRETLVASKDAIGELTKLQEDLADCEKESDANAARAKAICESVGIEATGDISNDIETASGMLHALSSRKNAIEEAQNDLDKALAAVSSDAGAVDTQFGLEEVRELEHSPKADEILASAEGMHEELARYENKLTSTLDAFDLEPTHDLRVGVERLRQALDVFDAGSNERMLREERMAEARKREEELSGELDEWAHGLGLDGERALDESTIAFLREDVGLAERLTWEMSNLMTQKEANVKQMHELERSLRSKLSSYGIDQNRGMREAVGNLSKNASILSGLENDCKTAAAALDEWERENGPRLDALRKGRGNEGNARSEQVIDSIQKSREELLSQIAQCGERRESYLREAEEYPSVLQRIVLLAQEKQDAVSNLATVQGAADYLRLARERIDGRYLNGLVSRFNEYSDAWLGEDMDLDVNGEFEVTVAEDDVSHDLAYYSTGYREVLGVCLRMAFVDTIFDQEEPFLVMDDPFANLDQRNLNRALSVLRSLAKSRQIIYFTCHSSRVDAMSPEKDTDFVLPQRKPRLELPRERTAREKKERAARQAAMVAAYHVVPVTQGRASIELADDLRVVSNNIFNLRFVVSKESGRRDNAFEAFFIDGKGKALCEKMSVEVRDGHVVPETLRFRLITSDNGGGIYELIIHEQGKGQTELVSRTAFRAEVAFGSEDFGF